MLRRGSWIDRGLYMLGAGLAIAGIAVNSIFAFAVGIAAALVGGRGWGHGGPGRRA